MFNILINYLKTFTFNTGKIFKAVTNIKYWENIFEKQPRLILGKYLMIRNIFEKNVILIVGKKKTENNSSLILRKYFSILNTSRLIVIIPGKVFKQIHVFIVIILVIIMGEKYSKNPSSILILVKYFKESTFKILILRKNI